MKIEKGTEMRKENKIDKIDCKKCLHYEGCLKRFRQAKKNGQYELIDENEYFSHGGECDMFITGYHKQREGEWIDALHEFGFFSPRCSVCNRFNKYHEKYDYCPNCGAKMKGGE